MKKLRTDNIFGQSIYSLSRHICHRLSFDMAQRVWFHCKRAGWRSWDISGIERRFNEQWLYTTLNPCIWSYYGQRLIPNQIGESDNQSTKITALNELNKMCTTTHTCFRGIFVVSRQVPDTISNITSVDDHMSTPMHLTELLTPTHYFLALKKFFRKRFRHIPQCKSALWTSGHRNSSKT